LYLYDNGYVAIEGIDNFDAGDVFAGGKIAIGGITDGFAAAVFAAAVVLPVVGEVLLLNFLFRQSG
jgi:hypothetical protein